MKPIVCIVVAGDAVGVTRLALDGCAAVVFDGSAHGVPLSAPADPAAAMGALVVARTIDDPDDVWSWAVTRFQQDQILVLLTAESPASALCRRCIHSLGGGRSPDLATSDSVVRGDPEFARSLVSAQAAAHVDEWVRVAGTGAVHVVVVPPAGGRDILIQRLAWALVTASTAKVLPSADTCADHERAVRSDGPTPETVQNPSSGPDAARLAAALAGNGLDTPAACTCGLPYSPTTLSALSDELIEAITGSGATVVGDPLELKYIPHRVEAAEEDRTEADLLAAILKIIGSSLTGATPLERGAGPEAHLPATRTAAEESSSEQDRLLALVHHQQVEMQALAELLERVREEYETSTSWRVTAPLRRAGSLRRSQALRKMPR